MHVTRTFQNAHELMVVRVKKREAEQNGGEEGRQRQAEESENVDVLYSGAITHQTSPPSPLHPALKKQNSVLTSQWRGAEGREEN